MAVRAYPAWTSSFIESDPWWNCEEEEGGNELPLGWQILLEGRRGEERIETSMDGIIGAGCSKEFQKPKDEKAPCLNKGTGRES